MNKNLILKIKDKTLNPFKEIWNLSTDGCSFSPDLNFRNCCVEHDFHYRNCDIPRALADKKLRECMAKRVGVLPQFYLKKYRKIKLPWVRTKKANWIVLPWIYWIGVRIFAWNCYSKNRRKIKKIIKISSLK